MLRCSVSTPREGCGVWSFFLSVIAATQGISLFFSLVHCICFPSAALLYLSILVFVFTLDLFFFFYLSTYTMMMMTTNRRQCTIYSRRYPPILPPFLLTSSYPYIHTYSHDHCRLFIFLLIFTIDCSTGSRTYPSEVVFFFCSLLFALKCT